MDELSDLSDLAERRFTDVGAKLRANLVPPFFTTVRRFDRSTWRAELLAGLTIAALAIPQGIAFALLIGIPVPAVVASAIVGTVLCSLFCSSRHLVFGPTNTISIILAGALLALAPEPLGPLEKVLLIGFLMGALQLAAGLSGLGKITQFVSRSVIVGYTTAVGILIGTGIGLENIFPAEENPTLATKKALQRAQQLLPNEKAAVRIFYSAGKVSAA